nr:MAG TPA: hypothetical protein [Caudoviricetes sp.]
MSYIYRRVYIDNCNTCVVSLFYQTATKRKK